MMKIDSRQKFMVGEIVKVLPKEEIKKHLDFTNKLEGCLFMEQMWQYCDHEFQILKVVRNIFNDGKLLSCRNILYMLEGVICDGKIDAFIHSCDRVCFLLWHEKWLRSLKY